MKFKPSTLIALTTATLAIAIGTAFAVPTHMSITTYFSDATKTEPVGESIVLCNGSTSVEGIATRFTEVIAVECPRNAKPCDPENNSRTCK